MGPRRFIVIDGLDGCGKDTQALLAARKYASRGERVLVRSHPSPDNCFGRAARKNLESAGKKAHLLTAVFFSLDVLRSLWFFYNRGSDTLIFVRYLMGTAYLPESLCDIAYKMISRLVPSTPYMFYLDVPANVALIRIRARGKKEEMFESHQKLKSKRRKIFGLAEKHGWIVSDGARTVNDTWTQLNANLDELDQVAR